MNKPTKLILGSIVGTLLICFGGLVLIGALTETEPRGSGIPDRPTPTTFTLPTDTGTPTTESTTVTAVPEPTKTVPIPTTLEDGLYHVGEDAPAGTYRLADPVSESDGCYWEKSTDAEGEDIIANDFMGEGRLQVTLKKGQWFESDDCGTWVKK